MFSSLPRPFAPLTLALAAARSNLSQQSAIAQGHLAVVAVLVRHAGEEAGAQAARSPAPPLLAPQATAATRIADGMVDVARMVCEMNARSAADLLNWWERGLKGLESVSVETVPAAVPVAAKVSSEPSAPPPVTATRRKAAPRRARAVTATAKPATTGAALKPGKKTTATKKSSRATTASAPAAGRARRKKA